MTKAMAPFLAESGVRINGIAPGVIKTKFSKALWENEDILKDTNEGCFMKRVGTPDEVAGTAVYLCSDDASYVTGETVIVAGGTMARL
jgi:dehydrogenase/reductase SDR family protein 4